jgi:Sulfotransferase family.
MIVSSLHHFIFVAIPKTGTHSVRRALRQHLGPQDIEQVRLFEQKAFPIPELAKLGHGHLSLLEVEPFMSAQDFQSFFKFAFVRNPFDRFVSFCAFMTRAEGHFDRAPQVVMRHFLTNPSEHILFRPQHSFLTDAAGELMTDYVGRVEQMQQSYDEICARIGVPSAQLEKVNTSRREDYRGYYDQPLIDGVASLYARDLEYFGYEF